MFQARLKALEQVMERFDASRQALHPSGRTPFYELQQLKLATDDQVVLVLRAPTGKQFDGKLIWDVMKCLKLRWGDMDCFHWRNPSSFGDDYLFSVETSTSPGYFLPEEISADRVHVDDLVFVYSVPRSPRLSSLTRWHWLFVTVRNDWVVK